MFTHLSMLISRSSASPSPSPSPSPSLSAFRVCQTRAFLIDGDNGPVGHPVLGLLILAAVAITRPLAAPVSAVAATGYEPKPLGNEVSTKREGFAEWVQYFDHSVFGSRCAPSYGPLFAEAATLAADLCDPIPR